MQRCRVRDYYDLPSSREVTPQGFLRAPAKIARTGIQVYTALELGLDGGDKPYRLYRPPEEVAKSARSFESVPMADEHPPVDVTSGNWKQYAVGDVHGVAMQGDYLCAQVIVRDADAISLVRDGKAELSCGYGFVLDMTPGVTPAGEMYDAVQRDIEGNHVAIVDRGRAGSRVRIADNRGAKTMTKHRINVADQKLSDKVTIPGLDFTIELDDDVARSVRDKFDLHAHGIGAAKDAYDNLMQAHKSLQAHAETMQDRLDAMGDDDDDGEEVMEEDDKAFAGEETEEEEAQEEASKKKTGDGARKPGYTKDGRRGLKLRLKRAVDEVVRLRKLTTEDAISKLAEERQKVIDAAKPFVAEGFKFEGKGVHDIRLAVIDAARKDEGLKEIVKIQVGDGALDKLRIADVRKAFATVVAMGAKRSAEDDGQDPDLSRALAGDDAATGADGGGGPRTIADANYNPAMQFYAREAARSRQPANGIHRPGDAKGVEVED